MGFIAAPLAIAIASARAATPAAPPVEPEAPPTAAEAPPTAAAAPPDAPAPVAAAPGAPAVAAPPSPPVHGARPVTPPDPMANPPDTRPVVRPMPGNWGLVFIFGGLAPLSIAGLGDLPLANGLIFTELGIRRVLKKATVTFSFGAGVSHTARPGDTRPRTTAGISGSLAAVRGFRVWRRIAPYAGGFFHAHYIDASGPDNWLVGLAIGPILGVEYFIADRVGLWGQGVIGVGPTIGKTTVQWVARTAVDAGGHFGLTFYF